jgi:hypothetical protein
MNGRWLLLHLPVREIGASSIRRSCAQSSFLEDRFGVDRDLKHVADDDATPVQSAVPAHAEVVAVDRGGGGKARPGFRSLMTPSCHHGVCHCPR